MTKPQFYRDTWVEVQLQDIYENVQSMRQYLDPSVKIIGVVKANAYGHGDVQVAKTALKAGASILAVAFLDEAISLRKSGIEAPILVLGATHSEDANIAIKYNISVTVYEKKWLEEVVGNITDPLSVHIKYDTGMNRLGLKTIDELRTVLDFVKEVSSIKVEGLYTHFSSADEIDTTYTEFQYENFIEAVEYCRNSTNIPIVHCGNSATGLRFPTRLFNAVRLGIAMYGLSPSEEMKEILPFPLKGAFSLHSRLSHVKKIHAGEKVSYGATYTATEDEWIGTVPIGYADGWSRSLSMREVLVDGRRTPIIGRICMDQLMIRLPQKFEVGTKVTLIGKQDDEYISVDEVASALGTINYEITCMISYRVPRVFMDGENMIEVMNPLLHHFD
ncbi:alanine racemase [Bacillus suaedaesalsae]|uniref:Alanine racemase n=1 Tax=Bacillus suaedaesalsae TaxID=2810349 RepID=A0ABS2DI62_9BACI|nr:alanine racemase [Bacillus suaedaesalsae]MBM6617700.1 alanine racemase [Bacillus suaedaesalsae]